MSARRITLITLVGVASLVALVAIGYGVDQLVHRDQIVRNVIADGVPLGGLTESEAADALLLLESDLQTAPAHFHVGSSLVELDPVVVGFDLDEQSAIAEALTVGRTGGLWGDFTSWLSRFGDPQSVPLSASIDRAALDEVAAVWNAEVVANPPVEGGVTVESGQLVGIEPQSGVGIDTEAAYGVVLASLRSHDRGTPELPTRQIDPITTADDVAQAVASAETLLSGDIVLTRSDPDAEASFTPSQLAPALISQVIIAQNPFIWVGFDADVIEPLLDPLRERFEAGPTDAEFAVEGDEIVLVPGHAGSLVDASLTAKALRQAGLRASRTGELPFEDGAPPEVTTDDLAQLGIEHMVSKFTTYHSCCQSRVINIHLIADKIDGVIVEPGATFSVNEYVGRRMSEDGFLPGGTIVGGEIIDTVGGGVSQFATTFYNAVFWGGYEDVAHSPHSYYFSRYPEGIEATISWPLPHLSFRNDTDKAILIKTQYTDTSISVLFFGSNGGRRVSGEQSNGATTITVLDEGSGGREITANVSDRYSFTEPPTNYVANAALDPAEPVTKQKGRQGWAVTVTRTITVNGESSEEKWVVRYRPQPTVIEVHPCLIPEGKEGFTGEECPVPETTTTVSAVMTGP